ncbi:MAG: hypothetical protein V1798_10705 [Pseudomonadota bacterium]
MIAAGALLILLWAQPALSASPCAPARDPARESREQIEKDTVGVFGPKSVQVTPTPNAARTQAAPLRVESDRLILAGTRAGAFEIGSSFGALSSKVKWAHPKRYADPRYAFILPLGYVPERDFADSLTAQILLAFSTADRTVFEIFVRDPAYSTPEGIRVGTPADTLKRVSDFKRKHTKRTDYFQGEGITFLVSGGVVTEIAVVRKVQK